MGFTLSIAILYILGYIENITLSTYADDSCGGYNVSVEIFEFPNVFERNVVKCRTKAWKYFEPGDTLIFDHKKESYSLIRLTF